MKKTNRYQFVELTKNGTRTKEVRAANRRQAAQELRCPIIEVEFLETVNKTVMERRGDHAAKMPIPLWDLDRIVDVGKAAFKSRRSIKKKVTDKKMVNKKKGKKGAA